MINNVILLGRLTKDPELITSEKGNKRLVINLAVDRDYKNQDGIYETDFIRCVLWNGIAGATSEFCKVGDVVGIKGRLQTSVYETEDKKKNYSTEVIAERVTFLSSGKKHVDEKSFDENDEVKDKEKPKKSSKKSE